jgi:hypothetical protein
MATLKIQILDEPIRAPSRRPPGVTRRRLRTSSGEMITVHAIDANSPTFSTDFLWVFAHNVKVARAENKRLLGSPDGIPRRK